MKKIVTSVLGISLLAGSLYAGGNHHEGMKMSKEQCAKMHKAFHDTQKTKANKPMFSQKVMDALYPPSNEE